jgi:hypothetical protein
MRTHHLTRTQRGALTVALTLSLLLPLFILAPRFINWQADRQARQYINQVQTANTADTITPALR